MRAGIESKAEHLGPRAHIGAHVGCERPLIGPDNPGRAMQTHGTNTQLTQSILLNTAHFYSIPRALMHDFEPQELMTPARVRLPGDLARSAAPPGDVGEPGHRTTSTWDSGIVKF